MNDNREFMFEIKLQPSLNSMVYTRRYDNFYDLIGNFGGQMDFFFVFFAFFVNPIAAHFYNLELVQRLFLTKDS